MAAGEDAGVEALLGESERAIALVTSPLHKGALLSPYHVIWVCIYDSSFEPYTSTCTVIFEWRIEMLFLCIHSYINKTNKSGVKGQVPYK